MPQDVTIRLPQKLIEARDAGTLIPFVGAGVSMALRGCDGNTVFPSWLGLLERAAVRLEVERRPQSELIRAALNQQPPATMLAAEWAQRGLGTLWPDFLKDVFNVPHNAVDSTSLELAKAVWGLGSKLVITTNYDRVLRWSCPDPFDLTEWSISAPGGLTQALQGQVRNPTVWHLHGSISSPSEVILSPDGYSQLYPSDDGLTAITHKAALETLRHLMMSRHLFFLGFSLEDEYLMRQLQWVSSTFGGCAGPHYVLARSLDVRQMRTKTLGLDLQFIEVEGFSDMAGRLRQVASTRSAAPSVRSLKPSFSSGAVIGGRYELGEPAGSGSFSRVWKAWDKKAKKEVALKVLHAHRAENPVRVRRFCRGAEVAARLQHANIVPTTDGPKQDGPHHYYVMPWLTGGTLQNAVLEGKLDVDAALRVVADALKGLAYAHDLGIAHRDVKPTNILIHADGRGLIADFDCVHIKDARVGTRSVSGMMSMVYAAPELFDDAMTADTRVDVYGAAMSTLFILMGKMPPLLIMRTQPELLLRIGVGPGLRSVLECALKYQPEERSTSIVVLMNILHGVGDAAKTLPRHNRRATQLLHSAKEREKSIESRKDNIAIRTGELGAIDPIHPQNSPAKLRQGSRAFLATLCALILLGTAHNFTTPTEPPEKVLASPDVNRQIRSALQSSQKLERRGRIDKAMADLIRKEQEYSAYPELVLAMRTERARILSDGNQNRAAASVLDMSKWPKLGASAPFAQWALTKRAALALLAQVALYSGAEAAPPLLDMMQFEHPNWTETWWQVSIYAMHTDNAWELREAIKNLRRLDSTNVATAQEWLLGMTVKSPVSDTEISSRGNVLNSQGWATVMHGDLTQAQPLLEECIALTADNFAPGVRETRSYCVSSLAYGYATLAPHSWYKRGLEFIADHRAVLYDTASAPGPVVEIFLAEATLLHRSGREHEAATIVETLPQLVPDYNELARDVYWYERRIAGETDP